MLAFLLCRVCALLLLQTGQPRPLAFHHAQRLPDESLEGEQVGGVEHHGGGGGLAGALQLATYLQTSLKYKARFYILLY